MEVIFNGKNVNKWVDVKGFFGIKKTVNWETVKQLAGLVALIDYFEKGGRIIIFDHAQSLLEELCKNHPECLKTEKRPKKATFEIFDDGDIKKWSDVKRKSSIKKTATWEIVKKLASLEKEVDYVEKYVYIKPHAKSLLEEFFSKHPEYVK